MLGNLRPAGVARGPQPISEILSRLMSRKGYGNVQTALEWTQIWGDVAGSHATHSRAGKVSRGVLEVVVRNSAVMQELTFRKKQLLQAIQQKTPQAQIKDLRFRVGEID